LITQHHAQGQTRPYAIRHYFLFTFSMNRPSEFKNSDEFLISHPIVRHEGDGGPGKI